MVAAARGQGSNATTEGTQAVKIGTRNAADGQVVGVFLTAETEADLGRLAVILSDLGENRVDLAEAVVVRGAAVVTTRRQVLLFLRGAGGPKTAAEVAAAVKISANAARARLCDLVGLGDVARTGDDRFDLATRAAAPVRPPVGRPRCTVPPSRGLGRPKTSAVKVRGGAR